MTGDPDPLDLAVWSRMPMLAVVLATLAAGVADGLAFVRDGVFVANQSGNLALMGIAVAGRSDVGGPAVVCVMSFAVGLALALGVSRWRRLAPAVATRVEVAVVLAATWALWDMSVAARSSGPSSIVGVSLASTAMGALSAAIVRARGLPVAVTYMTGTVQRTVQSGVGVGDRRAIAVGAMGLACFVAGSAVGAALSATPSAVWLVPVLLLAVRLLLWSRGPHAVAG